MNNIFKWEFTGKVPEEGIAFDVTSILIPSLSSETNSYINFVQDHLELATLNEFKIILFGYYSSIVLNRKNTVSPFLENYLKENEQN